jgi:hypothetical protein
MKTETEPDWDALGLEPVPAFCQARGCLQPVATWCPLCGSFLCAAHDELTPERRHDCLGGKAHD